MKKHFIIIAFAFSLAIYGLSLSPLFVTAQGPLLSDSLIEDAECSSGNCSLNTFIALGVSLSNIILGLVGALTLAMFIYGGVTLLISGGSAEKISKGKEIILGSVVGLLIVFGSFTIIKFVVDDVLNANKKFDGSSPPETVTTQVTKGDKCKAEGGECVASCTGATINSTDCSTGQVCCMPTTTSCELPFICSDPGSTQPLCNGNNDSGCYICQAATCTQGTGFVKHCCKYIMSGIGS
ncbi:hypothetical protein IPN41_00055 [Candidatus Falkowbacteria bacterium]|nr:MAG: hypothetical protein IPN41_00055 [Candidatus Falkowbacteria bacterium]